MAHLIDAQFWPFVLITLVLTVSPGVDTFLVIRNVLRGGTIDGVWTSLGICSGLYVHAALSACGISMLVVQSALLFQIMKTFGALYLCWLGLSSIYQALIAPRRETVAEKITVQPTPRSSGSFREGFLSNIFNPKPAVFYLAFLPQFVHASDPVLLKSMFLASVQFVIGILWLMLLSVCVVKLSSALRNTTVRRAIDTVTGSLLLAFGVGLLFDDKR